MSYIHLILCKPVSDILALLVIYLLKNTQDLALIPVVSREIVAQKDA